MERLEDAQPLLAGVGVARDLLPGMGERTILHAGPPIEWADMSGPLRGAVVGAALYEGWPATSRTPSGWPPPASSSSGRATSAARSGRWPAWSAPSMPMCVVENDAHGNRAFCTFNEGLGKVLRYGAYDDEVLDRLAWIRDVLARVFAARSSGWASRSTCAR